MLRRAEAAARHQRFSELGWEPAGSAAVAEAEEEAAVAEGVVAAQVLAR